jgi:hypothetical protein
MIIGVVLIAVLAAFAAMRFFSLVGHDGAVHYSPYGLRRSRLYGRLRRPGKPKNHKPSKTGAFNV